jgi:hypothetical protein
MFYRTKAWRIAIDGFLWAAIALFAWFLLTRHFVALLAATGRWQRPGISRVLVGQVQRDTNDVFTDVLITVDKDGRQKATRLPKEELFGVEPGEKLWIIWPPYVSVGTSPPTYRFSLGRLVMEFPEIFLLICCTWLFMRFKSRLGKPFDEYVGPTKPTSNYVAPSPESWGRSKNFINKGQDENS